MIRFAFVVTSLLATSAAFAQDECMTTFSHAEWKTEMDEIDTSFASFDLDNARLEVDATWRHVGCLDSVAKTGYLARFMRQRAMLAFFDQDEDNAIKWGLAARHAAADFPWTVPEDHPFRTMIAGAEDPAIGGAEGSLIVPPKGHMFMDGKPLLEPKANAEIPNLIQVTDKKGAVVSTFWQDGAAFPADIIGPPGEPLYPPLGWCDPGPETYAEAGGDQSFPATEAPPREACDPGEVKPPPSGLAVAIPNAAAGGALAVVAGVFYGVALSAHGHLDDNADSIDHLTKTRSTANLMVLGSAVAGAAAVGIGVTAFIDTDGAGAAVHVRF
jgi:hypothetical protein